MKDKKQYPRAYQDTLEHLNFSYNWNGKLFTEFFTTIRLYNPEKFQIEKELLCLYTPGKKVYKVGVVRVISVRGFYLDDIPKITCYLDTGYNDYQTKATIRKMYQNKGIDFSKQKMMLVLLRNMSHFDLKERMKSAEIFAFSPTLSEN